MPVKVGFLLRLEAKPGKGRELGAFLERGREFVMAESGTVTWYAFRVSETEYGIFDAFETEEAREAHHVGGLAKALGLAAPEMLTGAPDVHPVQIVAAK